MYRVHDSPVQARCSDEDSKACLSMQHLCRQSPVACLLFSYLGDTESLCSWTSEVDSCTRKDSGSLFATTKCGERLCPPCNASSCMSALCKNSSSALMRMTLMNKVTVPVACQKPRRIAWSHLLLKDGFELCTHTAHIPRPESAVAIHAKSNSGTTRKESSLDCWAIYPNVRLPIVGLTSANFR